MLPRVHKYDDFVKPLTWLQQAGFHSAIIAGGAFRDLYHEIYPRDIDIFAWDPNFSKETTPFEELKNNRKENPGHVWRTGPDCDKIWANLFQLEDYDEVEQRFGEYDEQEGKITAVWDIFKTQTNFQVIFTKLPPIEHMEQHFNIGLCKCYCDGQKIRYTNDFVNDATNKTLTIVGKNMSHGEYRHTIDQHIPRLRQKYPYPVRYSAENEKFLSSEVTIM